MRFVRGRRPSYVEGKELLGRELFSSKVFNKTKGTIRINAFQPKSTSVPISVNRLSLVPIKSFIALGRRHARKRKLNFYGFAEVEARIVRRIYKEVMGSPTIENPFHADILLPSDNGKDLIMDCARQVCEEARLNLITDG